MLRRSSLRSAAATSILSGASFIDAPKARGRRRNSNPRRGCPTRLLAHLRRWHRLGIAKHAVIEWNGKPVRSVRKGFAAAVAAAGLPTSGRDKITPHVLRHTAATWAMQNGANLWQAADFLGMTVEMLQYRYGHHHPDFQRDAAEAVASSPGQKRDRNPVNKSRQTSTNVTKTADFSRGGAMRRIVRDVGVAGSNPATPTSPQTLVLIYLNYLSLL